MYEALASCYLAAGATTRAVALLERCIAAADPILQVRYRSHLGTMPDASGDSGRARALVVEAAELEPAKTATEPGKA